MTGAQRSSPDAPPGSASGFAQRSSPDAPPGSDPPLEYDEMSMFHENAAEFGIEMTHPPAVRRVSVPVDASRRLSALVWGEGAAELVLLHGGAQNAHTWDTVALALDRPLVALDLPGHGHSDDARTSSVDVVGNAEDVAAAVDQLAPKARVVVGMSLGGLTALALATARPELVGGLVLVDITPGVTATKSASISAFVRGPASFPNFDQLLARTIEHNPSRSVSSLRRGILHNAERQPDGSWRWRYRRGDDDGPLPSSDGPTFSGLWDALSRLAVPVMLVRGMLAQSVVDDADEAELRRRLPSAAVIHVADAGHSVQGDSPLQLAGAIEDFLGQIGDARRELRHTEPR